MAASKHGEENTMSNSRYRYFGLEQIDLPRDERGYYQHFTVFHGDECVVDFYVNKDFEGMFVKRSDGTYHQTAGTCQYHFPTSSKQAARRELRRIAISNEQEAM
jgi:hypothetical protein